jgi:hypothetical protein
MTETTTSVPKFDATAALDDLLADVGLSAADAGGRVTLPDRIRSSRPVTGWPRRSASR